MSTIENFVDTAFEDTSWFSFHDSVFGATDKSLTKNELKELFMKLPVHISAVGVAWGLSDTVFNDEVYRYLEENNVSD